MSLSGMIINFIALLVNAYTGDWKWIAVNGAGMFVCSVFMIIGAIKDDRNS